MTLLFRHETHTQGRRKLFYAVLDVVEVQLAALAILSKIYFPFIEAGCEVKVVYKVLKFFRLLILFLLKLEDLPKQ